jgi:hypothetical protein
MYAVMVVRMPSGFSRVSTCVRGRRPYACAGSVWNGDESKACSKACVGHLLQRLNLIASIRWCVQGLAAGLPACSPCVCPVPLAGCITLKHMPSTGKRQAPSTATRSYAVDNQGKMGRERATGVCDWESEGGWTMVVLCFCRRLMGPNEDLNREGSM